MKTKLQKGLALLGKRKILLLFAVPAPGEYWKLHALRRGERHFGSTAADDVILAVDVRRLSPFEQTVPWLWLNL